MLNGAETVPDGQTTLGVIDGKPVAFFFITYQGRQTMMISRAQDANGDAWVGQYFLNGPFHIAPSLVDIGGTPCFFFWRFIPASFNVLRSQDGTAFHWEPEQELTTGFPGPHSNVLDIGGHPGFAWFELFDGLHWSVSY
jgi:hypothetical protein